jgi:PKD repeat protein
VKTQFNNILGILLVGSVALNTSCSNTDPLPISVANFEVVSVAPEVDVPVKFENQSLNSSIYAWDFGDGATDSLTIAPEHAYDSPGNYLVKLTAYTEDGQKSEAIKEVSVGERFLTGMYIIHLDMLDTEGNPWDDDGSGPDVLFQLGPTDAEVLEDLVFVYFDSLNVGQFSTPIGISTDNLVPDDYKLTNQEFFILMEEVDTVDNAPVYTPMAEVVFNPVVQEDEFITVTKRENGTGDIAIPFIVLDEYQWFLEFVIR